METLEQARDTIIKELTSDDSEVRGEYLKHFEADAKRFADSMAQAFIKWREFDNSIKDDEKRAHVSALVYIAITLNVLSMKVFLAGQTIAAGNLFRQVLESIALALLCSGKELDVLKRFMEDHYSSNDAVRDVLRHYEKLSLKGDALEVLKEVSRLLSQIQPRHENDDRRRNVVLSKGRAVRGRVFRRRKIGCIQTRNSWPHQPCERLPKFCRRRSWQCRQVVMRLNPSIQSRWAAGRRAMRALSRRPAADSPRWGA